jgi:flavodoxin
MKTLVTYVSVSGNTKKVAEAIYEALEGEKEIQPLGEIDSLEGYDLTFIGTPIHASGPSKDAKEFLEKHCQQKNVALFITHASPEESEYLSEWLGSCKEAATGANLVGLFNCQGELAQDIADMLLASDNPTMVAWAKGRDSTIGQPDAERLDRARAYARDVIAKLS